MRDLEVRRQRLMLSFKKSADTLASFDIYHTDIQVTFPSEEKRTDKMTFYYSPLVEYKIPVFRHPGSAMRTMIFPLLVTNLGTMTTLLVGYGDAFPYGSQATEDAFNARVNALVTILIALFAFLTFARSKLPDVPVTTIMAGCCELKPVLTLPARGA